MVLQRNRTTAHSVGQPLYKLGFYALEVFCCATYLVIDIPSSVCVQFFEGAADAPYHAWLQRSCLVGHRC